jgi:signal transduction histidine kinase
MVMSNAGIFSNNIEELVGSGEIDIFPNNAIIRRNGRIFRKIMNPDSGISLLFFRNENYQEEDIWRDIFRFLLLDLVILFPLWFMSHRVVRRTLEPVEESIETMSHFVHDAGHELKTPLAVVSGNLQILRDFPQKGEKLIESSIDTVTTMGDSIDGLLTLANIQKPQ